MTIYPCLCCPGIITFSIDLPEKQDLIFTHTFDIMNWFGLALTNYLVVAFILTLVTGNRPGGGGGAKFAFMFFMSKPISPVFLGSGGPLGLLYLALVWPSFLALYASLLFVVSPLTTWLLWSILFPIEQSVQPLPKSALI